MMKIIFVSIALFTFSAIALNAQTKKDGTPDMRFKANREMYGNTYAYPSYNSPTYSLPAPSQPRQERNYENGGQIRIQDGYMKSNGTYVDPHIKTTPDNNTWNNKGAWDPK